MLRNRSHTHKEKTGICSGQIPWKTRKRGVIIHTDKGNPLRYYYVGNNWAYNINSSIGGWDDTHKFAEVKEKGKYRLVIKPIRGRTILPGQEIKVWYPWRKFDNSDYLEGKDRIEYSQREARIAREHPNRRKSQRA